MAGFTNRGKAKMFAGYFQNTGTPTTFYMALCTAGTTPTHETDTLGQLTQVANGNGYDATNGGLAVARSAVGFDVGPTEVDGSGYAYLQIKDLVWTANTGNLPSDGVGARWAVLTTDDATVSNRHVIAFFDLVSPRVVSAGQTLTLQNCELRATE